MNEYQQKAIQVYHNESATLAARETAKQILRNSGWSQEDINNCKHKDPNQVVMIFLA